MVHVWGWDPGETTGWCHISVHDGEVGVFSSGEADHNGVGNLLYDNCSLKAAVVKTEIETTFAVERFVMNSKITQSPWSLETTGLIRYFSSVYHVPMMMQTPSQAKNLIKDAVIKRAGLYVPGQGHAMDAVRHALYFLIVKKGLLKECLTEAL
jgi:hypothetical protein